MSTKAIKSKLTVKLDRQLPKPESHEVRIWFQGLTGSGKSTISHFIKQALEAQGVKVEERILGAGDFGVAMEDQWVDLSHQNIDDILTVDLSSIEEIFKLQRAREVV